MCISADAEIVVHDVQRQTADHHVVTGGRQVVHAAGVARRQRACR